MQAYVENEMGLGLKATQNIPLHFTKSETDDLIKQFKDIDVNNKGFITLSDLRKFFNKKNTKEEDRISEETLRTILLEVDLNRNGQIDALEFLQFMSALKTGTVINSSFKHALKRDKITVDRSCGGV
ncbi:glycerol-3-phosphate dehydrogenase [Cichlidogyrus casuarinus]|uniref:Glycerol-3-phosphate dehydrogenase n=1 Tax=Cichlidogyrus casuarinus TaxID=1844966 RepID=A0ABD2QMN3_9PLAT